MKIHLSKIRPSQFQGKLIRRWQHALVVAALGASGTLQMLLPVMSQTAPTPTGAGTTISNTANATYVDPNDPTTPINATSNTVQITIAEVAGITVTPLQVSNANGGVVLPNHVLRYDFLVTNVGNDPTRFFIPNAATVTGPGAIVPTGIQVSTDGGVTYSDITGLSGFVAGPGGGWTTSSIAVNGSVRVRVPVTVNSLAPSGATIAVVLGNTGANDNTPGTQNQALTLSSPAIDVRTVDNPDGAGEVSGVPANGEREASASQQILVGSQPQAFAVVSKIMQAYGNNNTPNTLTDDTLTYRLSLRVNGTAPTGSSGLTPANLVGTTVNGIGTNQILVSDAIPAGTTLTSATPTAPNASWRVVYTTDPTTMLPTEATWSTTRPTSAPITRVGWVYDASTTPLAAGAPEITGFSFQVVTSGVGSAATFTVANYAQVIGQTEGTTTIVYDESGDQTPSNFNDNGTPGSNTVTTGVAAPGVNGVDSNNNNTGVGPGGEDNVFTLAAPGTILNGPNTRPEAVGPTDNNDDFTNRSTPIAAGTAPGSTIDPAAISFTNTINNPSGNTLTNVLLVPDTFNFTAVTGEVLPPNGTTVTLTFGSGATAQTATYTFNGTNFIFTSGQAIQIPSLAPNVSVNYTVSVDLPAGTTLSTDTRNGFSIPIYAFVDGASSTTSGRPDAGDPTRNRTINRVYTGFLRLRKEARVLEANGNQVIGFTEDSAALQAAGQPGRIIEYRVSYQNISIPPVGAGNVVLRADQVVINEDGTVGGATGNNWGRDGNGDNFIDTTHIPGVVSGTGTISFFSGTTGTTPSNDNDVNVTRYVNAPGIVIEPGSPATVYTFTFRRRIN